MQLRVAVRGLREAAACSCMGAVVLLLRGGCMGTVCRGGVQRRGGGVGAAWGRRVAARGWRGRSVAGASCGMGRALWGRRTGARGLRGPARGLRESCVEGCCCCCVAAGVGAAWTPPWRLRGGGMGPPWGLHGGSVGLAWGRLLGAARGLCTGGVGAVCSCLRGVATAWEWCCSSAGTVWGPSVGCVRVACSGVQRLGNDAR